MQFIALNKWLSKIITLFWWLNSENICKTPSRIRWPYVAAMLLGLVWCGGCLHIVAATEVSLHTFTFNYKIADIFCADFLSIGVIFSGHGHLRFADCWEHSSTLLPQRISNENVSVFFCVLHIFSRSFFGAIL